MREGTARKSFPPGGPSPGLVCPRFPKEAREAEQLGRDRRQVRAGGTGLHRTCSNGLIGLTVL